MGPDESARMVEMLRELKGSHHHPAGRARHGCGVRARRPHHRAGLWPRHRLGRPGGDPGRRRGARKPISASKTAGAVPMADAQRCSNCRDVETSYGLSRVLFGMSLAIAPGEMVSLMGRNGMGKTTTVRSIMGLTPAARRLDPLRRRGNPRTAVLSRRQARHRAGAGRPAGLSQSHRARKSGGHRRQPRRRRRSVDA